MGSSLRFWSMFAVLLGSAICLRLVSHGESVPLSRPLESFPRTFSGWKSIEIPIEPRIIRTLGVSDYISRVYRNVNGDPVFLYVGYYRTQRTGQSIHSPKNCLPGAGWEPVSSSHVSFTLPDGRLASINEYVVENGLQRQLVLYWYESHGRIIASEYWGKIYMVLDSLQLNRTDAALIRLSVPVTKDSAKAREDVLAFARAFLVESKDIFPK